MGSLLPDSLRSPFLEVGSKNAFHYLDFSDYNCLISRTGENQNDNDDYWAFKKTRIWQGSGYISKATFVPTKCLRLPKGIPQCLSQTDIIHYDRRIGKKVC